MLALRCNLQLNIGLIEYMKIRKIITSHLIGIGCLLSFVWLAWISHRYFADRYLFEWTVEVKYWYIWVLIFYLIGARKEIVAMSLSVGNIIGVFVGEFLGSYCRAMRMSRITPEMDGSEIWYLSKHYGVPIWLFTVVVFVCIGILIQMRIIKLPKIFHSLRNSIFGVFKKRQAPSQKT